MSLHWSLPTPSPLGALKLKEEVLALILESWFWRTLVSYKTGTKFPWFHSKNSPV